MNACRFQPFGKVRQKRLGTKVGLLSKTFFQTVILLDEALATEWNVINLRGMITIMYMPLDRDFKI
jgi:hypothetical protein